MKTKDMSALFTAIVIISFPQALILSDSEDVDAYTDIWFAVEVKQL